MEKMFCFVLIALLIYCYVVLLLCYFIVIFNIFKLLFKIFIPDFVFVEPMPQFFHVSLKFHFPGETWDDVDPENVLAEVRNSLILFREPRGFTCRKAFVRNLYYCFCNMGKTIQYRLGCQKFSNFLYYL